MPNRREFLKLVGATATLAGASGCGDLLQPPEDIVAYVDQPEYQVPGEPRFYASAALLAGYALPVVAETHEGRPTRVDGNPRHPDGGAGANLFAQAAVVDLYDPERSRTVRRGGEIRSWPDCQAALLRRMEGHARDRGAGLTLLTGATTSPTLARLIAETLERYPAARWYRHEPWARDRSREALRQAVGRPLDLSLDYGGADIVVSVDDDFLGPGPAQMPNARAWARRRADGRRNGSWQRLYVAEPTPTLTGARAVERAAVDAGDLAGVVAAIARRLGIEVPGAKPLPDRLRDWVETSAAALRGAGPRSLMTVGAHLPAEIQRIALAINRKTGALGRTVAVRSPVEALPAEERDLAALARDVAAGEIRSLVILDVDVVHTAPAAVDARALLGAVPWTLHAGLYFDETARRCRWHVPLAHSFESWGDAHTPGGTATIIQPLVRPLFGGRQETELLTTITGRPGEAALDTVRATWRARWAGDEFEARWRRALHEGYVDSPTGPPPAAEVVPPAPEITMPEMPELRAVPESGLVADIRPDPSAWDGRFVNNAWLQELPRPLTKLTWGNVALISEGLAARHRLSNGDIVELRGDVGGVRTPVWVLEGQADATITLTLGYGRRVGRKRPIGYDAYRLRPSANAGAVRLSAIRPTGDRARLPGTQPHKEMAGHDLLRTVTDHELRAGKRFEPPPEASLYPEWPYEDVAWGMVIDLDACIGCNNCVVACQAENNVPVVGPDQVAMGRAMHWLRIDVYRTGGADEPAYAFQPIPCMHCEKAPCEVGCPVNATVHGPEGLNQMIYNRCVGTRTCAAYCPYKVRVFNFHDYADNEPERTPQRNPDVTVRTRGVMEKCTYCVQRIRAARISAEKAGRPIRDGEVVTACQAACPTQAISFGNLRDRQAAVTRARDSGRHYALLAELGTRPRTTYLARVSLRGAGPTNGEEG